MTPNEKEHMERYIYQVIRRLPRAQRDEVRMELEELLSDMCADKGSMEEALMQLGDPAEFARQYQNGHNYLIGPEYFDTYLWFIKVISLCSAIPILAVSLIQAIGEMPKVPSEAAASAVIRAIVTGLMSGITEAFPACLSAIGAVTLIFASMEYKKIPFEKRPEEKWTPKRLSEEMTKKKDAPSFGWTPERLEPVPDKKAIISRGDSIAGIVFPVIFCALLIFAPHFFAVILTQDKTVTTVPLFNLDQWGTILPILLLSLLAGLADEILRLAAGVYCKPVMFSTIVCGILQIALNAVALKLLPIWNPDFVPELELALEGHADSPAGWLVHWNPDLASNGLLALMVVLTLFEIGVTVYRTLRYGGFAKGR